MTILSQINEMKKNGASEQEIISNLQSQGIAPASITKALEQSNIKTAVEGENNLTGFEQTPPEQYGNYAPQTQDMSYNQQPMNPPAQEYYSQNQGYSDQNYGDQQQENYDNQETGLMDTGTIIEVAEQVFEEKTKKITKQLDEFKEFSTLTGAKIINFEKRIEALEKIINNLQIKILEKVGSYGEGINSIKKEMNMMQDTFSKTLPEILKKKVIKKKTVKKKSVSKK